MPDLNPVSPKIRIVFSKKLQMEQKSQLSTKTSEFPLSGCQCREIQQPITKIFASMIATEKYSSWWPSWVSHRVTHSTPDGVGSHIVLDTWIGKCETKVDEARYLQ